MILRETQEKFSLIWIDCIKRGLTFQLEVSKAADSFGEAVLSELGNVFVHIIHGSGFIGEASSAFKIKLTMPVAMFEESENFFFGHVPVEFGWSSGGRVGHVRKLP